MVNVAKEKYKILGEHMTENVTWSEFQGRLHWGHAVEIESHIRWVIVTLANRWGKNIAERTGKAKASGEKENGTLKGQRDSQVTGAQMMDEKMRRGQGLSRAWGLSWRRENGWLLNYTSNRNCITCGRIINKSHNTEEDEKLHERLSPSTLHPSLMLEVTTMSSFVCGFPDLLPEIF